MNGKTLTTFYLEELDLTCAAHGFHRVTKTVILEISLVDSIITIVKKVFLKTASRVLIFKKLYNLLIYSYYMSNITLILI